MTANLFFVGLIASAFWFVFGVGANRFFRAGDHALILEDPPPPDSGSDADQQEAESDDPPSDLRTAFDLGFCDQTEWLRGFIEDEAGLRVLLARRVQDIDHGDEYERGATAAVRVALVRYRTAA